MPSWAASYLITLASHTGWSRDFILWELPLAQGFQLQHAVLIQSGATTVPTLESGLAELAELEAEVNPPCLKSKPG